MSHATSTEIAAIRSTWQFVYLNAFLHTFADCIDELEVDPEELEQELVHTRPGPLLADIHRALLRPLITPKGNEPWEKTLSRLLNKHLHIEDTYPFTENPVPAKHPEAYHALPATTKLDLLWLLCDWHLQKNKTIREKIDLNFRKPSSAMDKTSMNVLSSMPVGYDKQQRSYWYFGDWPRVYRRAKRHPLQPYAYDAWEVVTTTLDELAGLIEVFRKEFLNTESELKNALQRLLDRATMVQRRKRQVEKSRERAFALLHSNTLRETRTRTKQHVVRYDYETMHIAVSDEEEEEDEDEEEDEETTFVYQRASRRIAMAADARANGGGSHTARSRLTRSSSLLDDDAFESESEKDATTTTTTINTMRASSNKRKRHGTPSTIPPSDHDSSNEEDDDAYEQQQQQQHKYNRHTTSVVVQVPPPIVTAQQHQQSTLDAWTQAMRKSPPLPQ